MTLGPWDIALVAVVSLQCTLVAYLHAPRWKALVLTLPIPFTLATLALGEPVNVTHAAGILLFLGYAHAVRGLHAVGRVRIVAAIALGALGYALAGTGLAAILPRTDAAFAVTVGLLLATSLALLAAMPHRPEPGHRTPLPLAIKLPIIVAVITCVVLAKKTLHGFMTMFPMVGIVTAYEARHSLWTVCRQVPVFMLAFAAMVVTIRLTQAPLGLGGGLAVGWVAFLALFLPLTRWRWKVGAQTPRP